MDDNAAKGCGL